MRFLKRLIPILVGVFLFIEVSGCTSPVPASQSLVTPIILVTETSKPFAVSTDTPTVRATPLSTTTFTATPTQTQTSTLTPQLPSPTLPPPITLEPEQAKSEIQTLMEKPINCPSPCFWGVIPNLTTLGKASNFFQRLRAPLVPSFRTHDKYSASLPFNGLTMNVELETQNGLVKSIRGRMGLENYKGPVYPRVWSAFSPENLVQQYGKPSGGEFSIFYPTEPGFPEGVAWYSMVMRFDQYPFAVDYFDGEVRQGKLIRVCPLKDKFSVIDTYYGHDPTTYDSKGVTGTPLEKITSLNIDQFYELMIQGNGAACFDLNAEAYNNQ